MRPGIEQLRDCLERLANNLRTYQTALTQLAVAGVLGTEAATSTEARQLARQAHGIFIRLGATLDAEAAQQLMVALTKL